MSNDTAKTITTNIVPVQGTFEPLPPYECINLIGPAGTPFYAPVNPNLDGVNITNSTINSTTIGVTTPAAGAFTTASATNQPVGNNDLTTKLYVDSLALGISWKQPVNAATTVDITLTGAQTIDTVPVVAGDRVLVKNQSTASENGIYIVGTPWTRSPDANAWDELVSALVFVESGAQAGSAWYCPVQPGGTLGVTAVTWNNFSVGGVYFAGTGLNLSGGDTFNITNTGVTAATYGSASAVPTIAVNAQGQITSASNANIAIAASQITSGTIDSARISGNYSGITGVGTLTNLTVSNTITGSISGNAATATNATNAATATNIAGGATGSVPYQSAAGTTTFVGIGSTGQILTVSGGVPTWAAPAATGDVVGPASSTDNAIARFDSTTGKIIQNSGITLSDANALQNVNEINFDVTPVGVVGGAGSVSWNSDDNSQTLEVIGANNVPILVGEEMYYRIKASSAITAGQVVMFTGTLGASGGLTAAPATGLTPATGSYILGVATESIALNGWGYITNFGEVRGINTTGAAVSETWANGDILYYNPAVTGGLTKTVPTAPNAKVQVAAVVHAASNGILFVRPTFEPRLNDLSDVFVATPTNGDVIVWDSTDNRWENRVQSSLTAGSANNLTGGATGSLPYQSGAGATTFLAAGSDGQVLKLASGVPTWSSDASGLTIVDDTTTNATRYLTFTNATTGNISTGNVSSTKLQFNPSTGTFTAVDAAFTGTTAITLPVGTTAQRPGTPVNGMLRLNSSLNAMEVYSSTLSDWEVISYFTRPGAPTIGTATATSSTSATVTYTAPVSNGGSVITSYTAVASPGGQTGTVSQSGSGTITVSGLTSGVSYTFTVYATNAAGNSASSSASNSITTWTVPGAPTIGTATATGPTTATVSFTAPGNNGGTAITSYTAVSSPGGITGTLSQSGSGTITVTGLTASTSYTFTVYATNAVGNSASSSASNSITTLSATYSADMLVIAGGAGGGGAAHGGGGGAGGFRTSTQNLTAGSVYTITVGSGGSRGGGNPSGIKGGNGGDSTISGSGITTITSTGGGGGGSQGAVTGNNGGSGGGGGNNPGSGSGGSGNTPSTSPSQGNNGGAGDYSGPPYPGGGGGGAGAAGQTASSGGNGGNGGNGSASSITGSSVTYAGGGGGSTYSGGTPGSGGSGGGGAGNNGGGTGASATFYGSGGGGGGGPGDNSLGGLGYAGIVILSVPTSRYTGTTTGSPSVSTSGSNTIMQFTGSGSYTA